MIFNEFENLKKPRLVLSVRKKLIMLNSCCAFLLPEDYMWTLDLSNRRNWWMLRVF